MAMRAEGIWGTAGNPTTAPTAFARVVERLAALVDDPPAIAAVADRSLLHPNGFLKMPVWRGDDGTAIRVHTWLTEEDSADADAHDHRWHYASLLLSGALTEEEHTASPTPRPGDVPVTAFSYRSDAATGTFTLCGATSSFLDPGTTRTVRVGEVVVAPPARIHRVAAVAAMTTTLVVTAPPVTAGSTVYRRPGQGVPGRVRQSRPAAPLVRDCLARAVDAHRGSARR